MCPVPPHVQPSAFLAHPCYPLELETYGFNSVMGEVIGGGREGDGGGVGGG